MQELKVISGNRWDSRTPPHKGWFIRVSCDRWITVFRMDMNVNPRGLHAFLSEWVSVFVGAVRSALAFPLFDENAVADAEQDIDPDFKGWVRGDPSVTLNPTSIYGDDATGFLSGREGEGTSSVFHRN